ncbi:MAG: hypothetical protein Q9172_003699 [Xanthocarpia lactea]
MSSHQADWNARRAAMGNFHHGPTDPDQYRADRTAYYRRPDRPDVGPGFPEPYRFADRYDAVQGHAVYTQARVENDRHRNAYETGYDRHLQTIQGLRDPNERDYYKQSTGGLTPRAHRELKPLARDLEHAEARHASTREDVYGHDAMMYGTSEGQYAHSGHIGWHSRKADQSNANYNRHAHYEDDPLSNARDCYGREVPHGYHPDHTPYPRAPPLPGHYSTRLDAPEFVMKPAKQQKKKGGEH